MATRYGSAAGVITRTGVQPADLGLADSPALSAFLDEVLDEVTDVFDRVMRTSYLAEPSTPKGLDGIANDAAADSVRTMMVSRQTPVVRIDDFAVRTVTSRVLAPDIMARLRAYSAGGGVGSYELVQDDLLGVSNAGVVMPLIEEE